MQIHSYICISSLQASPVSSRVGTGRFRSAPSKAFGQLWWYRSTAAWSRGSSAWFHLSPAVGASFSQVLHRVSDCTPALLPPASSCPLSNAVTSPPSSRPISSSRCVSTWHRRCPAVVLSSTGPLVWSQGRTKGRLRGQKRSRAAVSPGSGRGPHIRPTRGGKDRMRRPGPNCQVGVHQV